MIKTYNKLVRDRIPEIIEASGKTCVAEILSDEDYLRMVDAKLDEELAEYTGGINMSVSYNKLWKLLIDHKMNKSDLGKAAKMSPNTIAKLGKNETVSLAVLVRICKV